MTGSDTRAVTWKTWPGASRYKAADVGGRIWSDITSKELTPKRTGTSRYWQVKYTDDDGRRRTRPVGVLVLLAHRGEPLPGQECCHFDDDPDNNDLANLRWDWPPGNVEDRMRNSPARPKPPKTCPRCGAEHHDRGRNCHACVVEIGVKGAAALTAVPDPDLGQISDDLGYVPAGVLRLAVKYGGLRLLLEDELNAMLREAAHAASPTRRLRSVLFRREASRRNSDGA